jgi:hypothetical protein
VLQPHDLGVEICDLLTLVVDLADGDPDLLIGVGAQPLEVAGEVLDARSEVLGVAEDLGPQRTGLRARGEGLEPVLEGGDAERQVVALPRPAEEVLQPPVEAINPLGLAGPGRLICWVRKRSTSRSTSPLRTPAPRAATTCASGFAVFRV